MARRVRIDDTFTYLVPSEDARRSFLGCSGLVVRAETTCVIDGNLGPVETRPMLEDVRPDICVVSHFHVDHSRWAHEAAEVSGVTLFVPRAEWRYLADVEHFVERCGLPDEALARQWMDWLTQYAGLRPVPDAESLGPGETIDLGDVRIEVVAAPGHSPGHQAFWEAESRLLFCVDIGVDRFGPWYGWKDARLDDYAGSIRKLTGLGAEILVTSHGGIVRGRSDARASLEGCLDRIREREARVRDLLDAGLGVERIARRGTIYGNHKRFPAPLDRMYLLWEENMIAEHARILEMGGIDAVG